MLPHRHTLALSLLFALPLCGTPAFAAEVSFHSGTRQGTLIELYTSQGCNSCPPAERWLSGLKEDSRLWKEIIPVAFHVDYWNYLGWPDTFSQAAFSERQRRYRSEEAISAVYTPGFVVNGKEWRRWLGLNRLPLGRKATGTLELSLDVHQLQASYTPAVSTNRKLTLNVAVLGVGLRSDIRRGENAGKTLPQDFAVLNLIQRSSNDGHWQLSLPPQQTPPGARLAIAAWVSPEGRQAPLQAVGGWLPETGATASPTTTHQ